MLLGYVKRKDLIRWLVLCTMDPSDAGNEPSDAAGQDDQESRLRRRSRRMRRRAGIHRPGEDTSDDDYVLGYRAIRRQGGWLGEGLGEGEGKNLVGKTYGTFWGHEDKGLGSVPVISEEEVQGVLFMRVNGPFYSLSTGVCPAGAPTGLRKGERGRAGSLQADRPF